MERGKAPRNDCHFSLLAEIGANAIHHFDMKRRQNHLSANS